MKLFVFCFLVVLAFFSASAQIPDYFANNPEWRIDASGDPPCIYHNEKVFFVAGDSIVDDISYKVLNHRFYKTYSLEGPGANSCPGPAYYEGFYGLYRQAGRIIYKSEWDNEEEIANYNYQVGDSIFQDGYFTGGIIDSISVEQIGGQDRLQFWYDDVLDGGYHSFIEGISSVSENSGELFSTYAGIFMSMYNPHYICFSENGETVHENPNNWEGDCYFDVSIAENESIKIGVNPNPCHSKVAFSSNESGFFKILNSAGQEVMKGEVLKGEQTLTIDGLAMGVYFIQVTSLKAEFASHRLVKM